MSIYDRDTNAMFLTSTVKMIMRFLSQGPFGRTVLHKNDIAFLITLRLERSLFNYEVQSLPNILTKQIDLYSRPCIIPGPLNVALNYL